MRNLLMFVSIAMLLQDVSLTASATTRQDEPLDFSCSTFPANLSAADLIGRFGLENVMNAPVFGSDDGPIEGTVLFPDRSDARVEIVWHDGQSRRRPLWIRVRGERSRWRTPLGIAIGSDLRAVEQQNGWPFRLSAFSTEGQGAVRSWGRGRLNHIEKQNCTLKISFQPRSDGSEDPLLMRQVVRGREYSSGHPAMQEINPRVAEIWIKYSLSPATDGDAVLDVVVWGTYMAIQPSVYATSLRIEIEQYLRRAAAYRPKAPLPSAKDMEMVRSAQIYYERRLAGMSDNPNAPALAAEYVASLRPCYEWEGFHDCPEREAQFADEYQTAHPNGPFSAYLPLLAAHRWLCTSEAYDYENKPLETERSRRLYTERLAAARKSTVLLLRTAAERLAERGRCHPSR